MSYANNRKKDFEFEIGDHISKKISRMKGMMRFVRNGKLSPCYLGH